MFSSQRFILLFICILLVHVMFTFTRLYIFESKFNNMEDINIVFRKFNYWHHYELVGLGQVTILLEISGSGHKFDGSGRMVTHKMWTRRHLFVDVGMVPPLPARALQN